VPVSRRASESGFTLVEVLIAATLMIIVLGATLGSFNNFTSTASRTFNFNDEQDQVRTTLEQVIRQVRNLANPTTGSSSATSTTIAYADDYRIVFQTSDPAKQWVSYCLDTTNSPASSTRGQIIYQTSTKNTLAPSFVNSNMSGPECPSTDSTDWLTQKVVGDFVTNKATSPTRPLFTYYQHAATPLMTTPVALSDTSKIVRVSMSVFMKLNPNANKPPAEVELDSAAWMRNQNQPPTAAFTAKLGGSTYTLDGGDSTDPEQRTLLYDWYLAPSSTSTQPVASQLPSCSADTPVFNAPYTSFSCLGTTVVVPNRSIPSGNYVFLRVTDPGGLQAISTLPGTGCATATLAPPSRSETECGAIP